MREAVGNLWTHPCPIKVITVNGDINKHRQAVMGRGVALQAKKFIPGIEYLLATKLRQNGLRTMKIAEQGRIDDSPIVIIAFPVKYHWHERANLDLIEKSCLQLVEGVNKMGWTEVVMPRPGCGNGRLEWETKAAQLRDDGHPPIGVKETIEELLDDRFIVLRYEDEAKTISGNASARIHHA